MVNRVILLVVVLMSVSCIDSDKYVDRNIIARVGDDYLYDGVIDKLIKGDIPKSDSAIIVNNYINKWARKKITLGKAKLNLNSEEVNFSTLVEEYEEDLIISAYRQKLVSQYLDTLVTDSLINSVYISNKSNFILNSNIVMVKYANFSSRLPNKDKVIDLINSDELSDLLDLESICYKYSKSFGVRDSTWVLISDLKMNMPELKGISKDILLKEGSFIKVEDSLNIHMTRILGVRLKGGLSPLSFVEDRIHNIVINRIKLDLIRNIENQLVEDAIKNQEFEIYN